MLVAVVMAMAVLMAALSAGSSSGDGATDRQLRALAGTVAPLMVQPTCASSEPREMKCIQSEARRISHVKCYASIEHSNFMHVIGRSTVPVHTQAHNC